MNAGLTLYLIEPRASDLIFYVENDPHAVFTLEDAQVAPGEHPRKSIQLFGTAQILASCELGYTPDDVQAAYTLKNRQAPGV